ncbi:hypothetical protein COCNU_02G012520 [Cocos nucifera]|uniref:LUC7 related protein n=1 Tax=Cocos nucifera TaxID=13894 RepID=A0A8K0HZY5_COCNU|nr:hypothetical protein COCNU_02G012520 [Cocos nucifera]
MDAIRKQLDVLMGANRNGDVREVNRKYEEAKAKGIHNFDRELEDLIERLIVECERKIQRALKRLEDEDAKAAIAISVSEVTLTPEVAELSKQIKEKLKEVDTLDLEGKTDSKIRALEEVEELRTKRADKQSMLLLDAFNKDRASLPQPLQNPPQLSLTPVLVPPDPRTQEMINEKLKKAEELGEKGMVDEAQKALEEAEALKKLGARQEPVLDSSKYTAADVRITDQKLRVCDICGAFLSVYDSDRRLADHFGGKLHLGYMQIREKLKELQVKVLFLPGWHGSVLTGLVPCNHVALVSCQLCAMLQDSQQNEVRTVTGQQVGIEIEIEMTEVIIVTGEGTIIVRAGTMIVIVIEIEDMIVNKIENQIGLAVMIQGAGEGHVLIQGNALEIMIGTDESGYFGCFQSPDVVLKAYEISQAVSPSCLLFGQSILCLVVKAYTLAF